MKTNSFGSAVFDFDGYPLEMLDKLVSVSLHPDNVKGAKVQGDVMGVITEKVLQEETKLQLLIKAQVFNLTEHTAISMLVRHYHSSLIRLMDQTISYEHALPPKRAGLRRLYRLTVKCIENLLMFIESHYSDYLGDDERVPPTHLEITRDKLNEKIAAMVTLRATISQDRLASGALDIVIKRMQRFQGRSQNEITFKIARYKKELVEKLLNAGSNTGKAGEFSPVVELLIFLNFNSKEFLKLLTAHISEHVNRVAGPKDRLEKMLYFQKAFNQVTPAPDVVYNSRYYDLSTLMNNWFDQEIGFLREALDLHPPAGGIANESSAAAQGSEKKKVVFNLSSDQIALILRGADEARVVLAKSMNFLFKTVVPHIATTHNEDLSFSAMRSRTYTPVEHDKEVAIEALTKIIDRIKRFD